MMGFLYKIFICFLFLFISCNTKVEVQYPEVYGIAQKEMLEKKYSDVLKLLQNENISKSQKTDWYYYDCAVSLYKLNPMQVRRSLDMLKIAYQFNNESFEINYYMGKFYVEINERNKAIKYLMKAQRSKSDERFVFEENVAPEILLDFLNDSKIVHINNILETTTLSEEEIIFLLECYFGKKHHVTYEDIELLENSVEKSTSGILIDYYKTKLFLFYLMLEDNDKVATILDSYNKNGIVLMSSKLPIVNEKFYKYLSFYYWKNNDGIKANNALHVYKRYHLKPLIQNDKLEANLDNIKKYFSNDYEFSRL